MREVGRWSGLRPSARFKFHNLTDGEEVFILAFVMEVYADVQLQADSNLQDTFDALFTTLIDQSAR